MQLSDDPGPAEAAFTFTGAAGQRVTITQTGSVGSDGVLYSLSVPGNQLQPRNVQSYGELAVLPTSGTWTLTATNITGTPTDVQVTLGLVKDTTAALGFGSSITKTTSAPGINHNLTFTGTAGQTVGITVSAATLHGSFPGVDPGVNFALIRPDGSQVEDVTPQGVAGPAFVSGVLDVSGAWTLRVDPQRDTTGSITFVVTRPATQVVNISPGTPTKVTLALGRDTRLRFPASAGQRVTLQTVAASLRSQYGQIDPPRVRVSLIDSAGVELAFLSDGSLGFSEQDGTLSSAGTWTLVVHPLSDTVGSITLKLGLATDTITAATLGQAYPVSIQTPGQNAGFTFSGTAGQTFIEELTAQSWTAGGAGGDPASAGARINILDSRGQLIDLVDGSFGETKLPEDGTYTAVVNGSGDSVGTATFTIRAPKVTTKALTFGQSTTATIAAGDIARYTFAGTVGQHGTLQITGVNLTPDAGAGVTLYRPDGSFFYSQGISGPTTLEAPALDAQGTWRLEFDPSFAAAGTITFVARKVTDQTGTLTYNKQVTTRITTPYQAARYTFSAAAGDRIAVDTVTQAWTNANGTSPDAVQVSLLSPSGERSNLGAGTHYPDPDSATTWTGTTLTTTGTWTLVIDPDEDRVGTKTFTLRKLETVKGGALTLGTAKKVTIPSKGAVVDYTFRSTGRAVYDWSVTGSTIPQGHLTFIGPDGFTVADGFFGPGASSDRFTVFSSPSGTYTLRVSAGLGQTGSATVKLTECTTCSVP